MTEPNTVGLKPIRRALLSVSDKAGLIDFARALRGHGVEILSTGGTARALREAGVEVRDVSDLTGFPEMLDGRVKTLHPRVHGGLLGVRANPEHAASMREHGIEPIDMVVVSLYPFEQTVEREGVTLAEAVEQIDIGGPAMIRSAAKNYGDVAVVSSPYSYEKIVDELKAQRGSLSLLTRARLARQAFMLTAEYDRAIFSFLASTLPGLAKNRMQTGDLISEDVQCMSEDFTVTDYDKLQAVELRVEAQGSFPKNITLLCEKKTDLRYGENPHQKAALFVTSESGGVSAAEVLGGKEMSYNNYVDADAAWQLVCDFEETACAIIKHTNPAGVGTAATTEAAYRLALATDPVSAFGGVVAFNRTLDETAARALTEIFTEVVVAPDYEDGALEVLKSKKNLRVLRAGPAEPPEGLDFKRITGGILIQTRDAHRLAPDQLKVVTRRAPTEEETRALLFAWTVCKHTKSNAIVYAREGQTVGVGAGQMSRVDSARLGAMRAQLTLAGSVVASDAFFPFRDGLDEAARHGVTAVIQPGGSVRDDEVIAAADEHGLAMVFTGLRHFRH
ncbi:MAG TPA: bifunctional phosphoribosylaminoimidazolecarboxamide formyltransferase/IMP cyclohydrolase [Pyrinomonadaceae bacterium]